ncbi:MAG: hypothetical protein KKA62_05420 [Nanoarchaeota archaeon]|nr:hypothetical protein [Nanoarchaeota archaeon]MBU1644130.1 hypothetical protein [Nanoarchaeota archaeon]MBU1977362.1 hypothetical protein [Nanoarchaeota archaeon]
MKNTKKGQAAMEFLMTYGWAILVVLVAIGALAYFGVLNPSRFLPSSCTIAPGVGCDDHKVSTETAQLLLRNGLGDDLTNVDVSISDCTSDVAANGDDGWTDGTILGGTDGITLTGCSNGNAGDRFKQDVVVTYTAGSGLNHTLTGSLTTKVE